MLSIACREVGQNCDCVVSGDTEEELMKNAAEHAVKDHGYKQEDIMTPEMQKRSSHMYEEFNHLMSTMAPVILFHRCNYVPYYDRRKYT